MRIISPFHDFYDGVQGQGFDDNVVYLRETRKADIGTAWRWEGDRRVVRPIAEDTPLRVDLDRPELEYPRDKRGRIDKREKSSWMDAHDHSADMGPAFGALYFCGRMYPFWVTTPRLDEPAEPIYSFEDGFDEVFIERSKPRRASWWHPRENAISHRKWLDGNWGREIDPDIHFHHQSPSVLFMGKHRLVDPCLRDFHFHRVIDAYTAFQEIDMFLGGVLGAPKDAPSPQSDIEKVVAHGLDPKWSFRKPPASS